MPVALLDYTNRPLYVPAAWVISAPQHLDRVIRQLRDPAPARMLFQNTALHDALECRSPAVPRAVRLMEEMIRVGRECRRAGRLLTFPRRILTDPQGGHHEPEEFRLADLHPGHDVFRERDLARLQAEVGQAWYELRWLRSERERLHKRVLRLHAYERLESLPVIGWALNGLRAVLSRVARRRPPSPH
jgi:hypothetical protein